MDSIRLTAKVWTPEDREAVQSLVDWCTTRGLSLIFDLAYDLTTMTMLSRKQPATFIIGDSGPRAAFDELKAFLRRKHKELVK